MGWKQWQQKGRNLLNSDFLREPFHILTITLLSLLLPLSFLLLARLSSAHYLLAFTPLPQPCPLIFSLFFYSNPTLLHALVSIISVATLIHGLTVCVGLGIEGSIAAGIDGISFGDERNLFGRVIFFLGLHETMLHWSRTVVKPIVDDTVFGVAREERWVERVVLAASCGSLWWWRLRNEVESLVILAEVKKKLLMGVGVADFVGWWLYYLTVTIGMVRIVKGLMWLGMVLLSRKVEGTTGNSCGNEDKV
ncbi:hypothetical protein L1049_005435 [Liquidambar formosana]|uniref:Transmembrane protein n=1 Tax=Liquidambar formosana TaxID=63359 RepID=A0AAP0RVE1_LIQFO